MRPDFDAPEIPDDVTAEQLDFGARAQLKTLSADNQIDVARHLAMVALLIDDDPELAHQHAIAASRRAGRIAMVRETLAITAYQLGDFALALRELRTYRRISGLDDQIALMVDAERGLGRPDRALELARSVDPSSLPVDVRIELAVAKSGARLDQDQIQAALEELRIPELTPDRAFAASPALFAAYANVLEDLGEKEQAAEWYAHADRAIDALEAAAEEGNAETVAITTEYPPRGDADVDHRQGEDEFSDDHRDALDAHDGDTADGLGEGAVVQDEGTVAGGGDPDQRPDEVAESEAAESGLVKSESAEAEPAAAEAAASEPTTSESASVPLDGFDEGPTPRSAE